MGIMSIIVIVIGASMLVNESFIGRFCSGFQLQMLLYRASRLMHGRGTKKNGVAMLVGMRLVKKSIIWFGAVVGMPS